MMYVSVCRIAYLPTRGAYHPDGRRLLGPLRGFMPGNEHPRDLFQPVMFAKCCRHTQLVGRQLEDPSPFAILCPQ